MTCTQWYSAEDNNGNDMPSTVYADLQSWNGSFWEHIDTLSIPSGLPVSTGLPDGERFRVVPEAVSGYTTPSSEEFTACTMDIVLVYVKPCPSPSIDSIYASEGTPDIGETVSFWRDGEYGGDGHYIVARLWEFGDGGTATTSSATHEYQESGQFVVKFTVTNDCGKSASKTLNITVQPSAVGNGFTIKVSNSLDGKTITVGHVVKIIGTDLWYWPQNFGYVGGQWHFANPATTYRIEVGDITETIPPFDKTYNTGSFADEIHCVVLAEGASGVNTLVFKDEDVFQLFADSPTEINLSSVSNDVISEAIMGPVCDFFGISRGSACNSFWAEFYDPVYVANYVSIMRTGKDTLGNSRQLSGFDHIALPFAILGSLPGLSLLPFGAVVTKGLKVVSNAGDAFSKDVMGFMASFSMDATNKICGQSLWTFEEAFRRLNGVHAREVADYLASGNIDDAETLLRRFAGECDEWWAQAGLSKLLEQKLPTDVYKWVRDTIGFSDTGAQIVTNVAKQAPPLSADDVAKLADAAKDSGVMDEAAAAVYKSLSDSGLVGGSTKVLELTNILKNNPAIGKQLIVHHQTIIHDALSGKLLTKDDIRAIAHHGEFAPNDIIDMVMSYTPVQRETIINFFDVDDYQVALSNLFYKMDDAYEMVLKAKGKIATESWVRGLSNTTRSALSATFAEAAVPKAAHQYAASYGDAVKTVGGNVADDIVAATDGFVAKPTSEWKTQGKKTTKATSNKYWNWFNNLSDANQENAVHGMVAAALVFATVVLYKIYTDAGPQSLNHGLFSSKMDSLYWPCYHSCEDGRADDLDAAIKLYESVINECAESLYEYKTVLESDGTYEEFSITLQINRFNLSRMKSCLEKLQPCGNIQCTSNTNFFYVDLDGQPAGFSFANYEVLLTAIKTGSHTIKIHKHLFTPECTESVNVAEGVTKSVDCQMAETGACSPVTAVSIYIDPLSPIEDETVSFNGSAKSGDPITKWEWDFGDGFTATGQAVTHPYTSKGIYIVELKVTNDCENHATTTRNVTVSEEEPPTESTTLQIQTPIGTDGNEIPRYWEIEIWVDGKDTACNPPETLTFGTDVFCDCTSPWNLVPCELGQHTITLKKYGYDDKSVSVYMSKDEPKIWYSPVMVKSSAPPVQRTVSLIVPVGSRLYVDGNIVT